MKVQYVLALGFLAALTPAKAITLGFETMPLGNPGTDGSTEYNATGKYYWNGSNMSGGFSTGGVSTVTSYDDTYGPYWEGFAYSNTTDTSTGSYTNQYSAYPGSGSGGSSNYLVAYQGFATPIELSFSTPQNFTGPTVETQLTVDITNTTYGALSMLNGNAPGKKFGGVSGNDPDWFLLTLQGWNGATLTGTIEFYLADYRSPDNSLDYVITDWTSVKLGALGSIVDKITFGLTSSDMGDYGINNPTYFALDNLRVSSVPEPSTYALLGLGLGAVVLAARRRLARS